MTVATEVAYAERAWSGVETSFSPGFAARDRTHVRVTFRTPAGARTLLALDTHFTVALASGTRIVTVTPVALPAAPGTLEIERRTPAVQLVDFQDAVRYPQEVHESIADEGAYRDAELRAQTDRAIAGLAGIDNAVAAATTQAGIATTQAGISTSQAGIATTKAGEAAASAALAAQLATVIESIKTANFALLDADRGKRTVANRATAITFTMPDLATATSGVPFYVSNIGVGALTCVTFEGDGSETFDHNNETTLILDTGDVAVFWKAGSVWRTLLVRREESLAGETDVASAATCNLGAVNNRRVRVTGTTTISSFGTRARKEKIVRFAGILTLTHSATLRLPTAANITTATDDVAIFASDNVGAWRCLSYQRADGSALTGGLPDGSLTAAKFPAANDTVVLPAIRRRLRVGRADFYDWGLVPGSSASATTNDAKWLTMLSDMRTVHNETALYPPPGNWWFEAPQVVEWGLILKGDGINSAVFNYNSPTAGLYAMIYTGKFGTAGEVDGFSIVANGANMTAGFCALAHADGYAPDFLKIGQLNITSPNGRTFAYPLLLDGNARGPALYTGTLSATPGSNVLTVAGTPWSVNQWATWISQGHAGRLAVRFTSGPAVGQAPIVINSNTANTLTLASAFSPNAASGNTFVIESYLYGLRNVEMKAPITFQSSFRNEFRQIRGFTLSGIEQYGLNNGTYITAPSTSFPSAGVKISNAGFGDLIIDNTLTFNIGTTSPTYFVGSSAATGTVNLPKGSTGANNSASVSITGV